MIMGYEYNWVNPIQYSATMIYWFNDETWVDFISLTEFFSVTESDVKQTFSELDNWDLFICFEPQFPFPGQICVFCLYAYNVAPFRIRGFKRQFTRAHYFAKQHKLTATSPPITSETRPTRGEIKVGQRDRVSEKVRVWERDRKVEEWDEKMGR